MTTREESYLTMLHNGTIPQIDIHRPNNEVNRRCTKYKTQSQSLSSIKSKLQRRKCKYPENEWNARFLKTTSQRLGLVSVSHHTPRPSTTLPLQAELPPWGYGFEPLFFHPSIASVHLTEDAGAGSPASVNWLTITWFKITQWISLQKQNCFSANLSLVVAENWGPNGRANIHVLEPIWVQRNGNSRYD